MKNDQSSKDQRNEYDLDKVERLLSGLLDDNAFQAINKTFGTFNIFEAIDAVSGELRHSNFLSYILSPVRPHGLGSTLLSKFLRSVLLKLPGERRQISALEITLGDLDSTLVERERDNIDILLEIPDLQIVVIIENKIGAAESKGQLARYKNTIARKFPDHRKLFVFLTPKGVPATDAEYVTFSYDELAFILTQHVSDTATVLPSSTVLVLNHYVEMLRRRIVDDEQLRKLARQLYEKYGEALEFIFESRPDRGGFLDPIRALIDSDERLVLDRENQIVLSFVPTDWSAFPELNSCAKDRWTKTGRSLLFEARTYANSDRVSLALVLGPSTQTFRQFLHVNASKNAAFVGLTKPMGERTSTIYIRDLLSPKAAQGLSHEAKIETISQNWQKFLEYDLSVLNDATKNFVHSFRSATN